MKKTGRSGDFPESWLVKAWQRQLADRTDLSTEEGEPIRVLYPGRINDDQGPDLLDAVITTSHGLLIGAVEVHVRSSGWWSHGHNRDPLYNQVVLHVVFWHDEGLAARLQDGNIAPTLALHKYIRMPVKPPAEPARSRANLSLPCRGASKGSITSFLDEAGEERFLAKAGGFQDDLSPTDAGQVLYAGIMGALGYARNKLPFLELARRLPLRVIEILAQSEPSDTECLLKSQALLLGTAGLLPSQRKTSPGGVNDEWVNGLEQAWAATRLPEAMSAADWRLFKVRPGNFPVRRIAAMSHLLLRYRQRGVLAAIVNGIQGAETEESSNLTQMLMVTADDYWADHFDFGLTSQLAGTMLLGSSRAAEIVVNVLLPFVYAWGNFTSQPLLTSKALEVYRHYPRLATNAVEKQMCRQLGVGSEMVSSARRQQGLLHIYHNMCSQGKCYCCVPGSGLKPLTASPLADLGSAGADSPRPA